ncbi:hypothetical protein KZ386_02900 [Glaesserella parasuis]|uniref:Lipoprotein n=3 Tax=Glaesserella parasuis TaxID=738 RepID=A0A836MDA6_GLAPU|nr:hypothetical protein [Glaesserella parasuis]AGO16447.1 hypothetical protein K756_06345 [Glaesserella parasuis ZJ0906]EQA05257.1 hypothetical protein HPS12939_1371 [Glaesserella parasuis 12939]KDB47203.1 hypothetical protein HPS9_02070 [Glaesserella parasuis HPS9]MCT8565853.1 hypothetical protein [Glaesserella parasuis]MCT8579238.1 hypothetical protein [Glaesserella parasuis]
MQILKRFFCYCLILCFMTACTKTEYQDENTKTETIRAFFIADNKLYVVGDLHSYQFESSNKENADYQERKTTEFIRLLQSEKMKSVTKAEIIYIKNQMKTPDIESRVKLTSLHNKKSSEQFYDIYGKLVKIENQDAVLNKAKLEQPLQTQFIAYSEKITLDSEATGMVLVWGIGSVVFIPLYIIFSPLVLINKIMD